MDQHNDRGSAGGPDPSGAFEPLEELYQQLRERLLADIEGIAGKRVSGEEMVGAWGSYAEDFGRIMTGAATALLSGSQGLNSGGADGGGDLQGDVVAAMADAYLAWLTRGAHYWGRLGERQGSYNATLLKRLLAMRADPERSEEQQRALVDETEAHLRAVADLSMQEARAFQNDLERIGRGFRRAMADEPPMDAPKRFARTKL